MERWGDCFFNNVSMWKSASRFRQLLTALEKATKKAGYG
jgi:uncharacterized protein YecE (DUF72 family)